MKKLLLIVGILILIQTDAQACHPRAGFKVFHTNAVEYVAYDEDVQEEIVSEPIQESMKISTDTEIENEYRRYEEKHLKPYLAFLAHQKALMLQKQEMLMQQQLLMQQRLAEQQKQQKALAAQHSFAQQTKQVHETATQQYISHATLPANTPHGAQAGVPGPDTPQVAPLSKPVLTRLQTNPSIAALHHTPQNIMRPSIIPQSAAAEIQRSQPLAPIGENPAPATTPAQHQSAALAEIAKKQRLAKLYASIRAF